MNSIRSIAVLLIAGLVSVAAGSAQTISVVSGNGQVLGSSNLQLQPLQVKVTDASGAPLANQTINWTSTGNGLFLATGTNQTTSVTDLSGLSTVFFSLAANQGPSINFLNAIAQTVVTAALVNGNAVNFTMTQLLSSPNSLVTPSVQAALIDPQGNVTTSAGDTLTGAVGTTSTRQIQIKVAGTNGLATNTIGGAEVQLLNFQDPATGPAVRCASTDPNAGFATVLTDTFGNATCNVVFGGQPGRGRFVVVVGGVPSATITPAGYWQFAPNDENTPTPIQASYFVPLAGAINEVVTPGAVGTIKISQGAGQSVGPGQPLPTALEVEVDSTAGQPLSGVGINWIVSPANAAVLGTPNTTTDFAGKASTSVTVGGNSSGTVSIKAILASDPSKSVTFSVSVIPPITVTSFNIVSGNNQSASVNTAFSQPLVVQLGTSSGSPGGVTVQFFSSGPVSLSATSATTDSNGRAQVNVSAGSVTGSANVTAQVAGGGSQTFNLTVTPPAPTVTAGNFVNGADFQPGSLSPCSLGALITSAGALGVTGAGPTFPGLPLASTNVSLTFSNTTAPILNVGTNSVGQQVVTFQVPCSIAAGNSVPVNLSVGSGTTPVNLPVNLASPGVFQTMNSDGVLRAVMVRPDGSYVSLQNPARRGETEIAYVTGLGPTSPPVGTQSLPVPGTVANVTGTVVPGIGNGGGANLVYARLSEDLPGVYLVAFQVPADAPTGNNVNFSIGIQVGSNTFYSGLSKFPVQ